MMFLDVLISLAQIFILKEVVLSPVWRSKRVTIECVKVMYVFIGTSAAMVLLLVAVTTFTETFTEIPANVRAIFNILIILYSMICHQSARIYNRRRIRKRLPKLAI